MAHQKTSSGFTLIELSIVLVIIGLMVGGIVGGRALIRQAELQSIVRDINSIKTALNAFQSQYDDMPGDFAQADQYWAIASNGNGNSHWEEFNCSEGVYAWQHMMLAEIITNGSYDGQAGGDIEIGRQAYPSRLSGTGFNLCWSHPFNLTAEDAFNYILYGKLDSTKDYLEDGALLAKEARSIDQKMDDGKAESGWVYAMRGNDQASGCTDVGQQAGSRPVYILSDATNTCYMMFAVSGYSF